jgi:threonine dehydrogenase-like Zn-dependent dehydrogenase
MQAVVTRGVRDSDLEAVPTPSIRSEEVLIEVKNVQMSVTECRMWTGDLPISGNLKREIENGGTIAFGHEFSGEIIEVGNDVQGFTVGDRVYSPGSIPCNECAYCRKGWEQLCENHNKIGLHGDYPGALAEFLTAPTDSLSIVPDEVSDAEAAALQPLADSVLTISEADIQPGDVVAVIGGGVMGNQCAQLARSFGAGQVIVSDVDATKVSLAEEMGMLGIDARETDPVETVKAVTDGIGADIVITAVGGDQSHITDGDEPRAQAFQMARRMGTVVNVGISGGEMKMDPMKMRKKCVDLIHPSSSKGVVQTSPNMDTGRLAAQMVSDGRVSIDRFTDHVIDGLENFEDMIKYTIGEKGDGSFGPTQISVSN